MSSAPAPRSIISITAAALLALALTAVSATARPMDRAASRAHASGFVNGHDGRDCSFKHALMEGRGGGIGLRWGDKHYIETDKIKFLGWVEEYPKYISRNRLSGHRKTPKVVLCRGMYQFAGSSVLHSFKVGHARGSKVVTTNKVFRDVFFLARFKR